MTMRGAARAAPLGFALCGCMPWAAGETARTVPAGEVRTGAALTALATPDEPWRPLPVPQAWVTTGVGSRTDVRVDYAVPLTFHARIKHRVVDRGVALAASAGAGIHGLPGVEDGGLALATPFASVTLHASRATAGAGPAGAAPEPEGGPYGALGMLAPFITDNGGAATLWITPRAGWSRSDGHFRWGPEIGAVIPTLHPRDTLVTAGLWASWSLSLP